MLILLYWDKAIMRKEKEFCIETHGDYYFPHLHDYHLKEYWKENVRI